MTEPLTDRQAAIIRFVRRYFGQHGYGPSMAEIAAAVGLVSASSVQYHLLRLELAGYIERPAKKQRVVRLTAKAREVA